MDDRRLTFQLAGEQADVWEGLPRAWWDHPDDPPVVVWGDEPAADRPRTADEIQAELDRTGLGDAELQRRPLADDADPAARTDERDYGGGPAL